MKRIKEKCNNFGKIFSRKDNLKREQEVCGQISRTGNRKRKNNPIKDKIKYFISFFIYTRN